eukprot:SAG22_NODE_219_length_14877_cov_14.334619_19_plen_392_part_00
MAGIFGPDNNKVWYDNFTISDYIADMEKWLPFHAFNAYDQVNAATTIVQQEGLVLNTLRNATASKLVGAKRARNAIPVMDHLQEFEMAILTLSPKGGDMPFHQHMTSWLYLAYGRKLWYISPPDHSPAPELLWNDPWDVINGWPQELDEAAQKSGKMHSKPVLKCLQKPGEILWLPKDYWHATANIDDCVGIGGHKHPVVDQRVNREFNEEFAGQIAEAGAELGIPYTMAQLRPWSGSQVMQLAKVYFGRRDFSTMASMCRTFNERVLQVYSKGLLTDDKLEHFMLDYMTEPLLGECQKMREAMPNVAPDIAKHIERSVVIIERMLVDLWRQLWVVCPTITSTSKAGQPLNDTFTKWESLWPAQSSGEGMRDGAPKRRKQKGRKKKPSRDD